MGNRKQSLYRWMIAGVPSGAIVVVAFLSLVFASPAAAASATPVPGSLDTTFGSGGYATVSFGSLAEASAVVVQQDGKIVTAGQADVNGVNVIVSTRMTSSGTLDASYGVGGIVTVPINGGAGVDSGAGLALQSDGNIVIAGDGRGPGGGPLSFAAVRLLTNGSLDRAFGVGGIRTVPIGPEAIANAVVIQPDGKIVLAGVAVMGHNEFAAVRLNADGTIDSAFGTGGTVTLPPTGGAWGMVLQPDGKLVLAGQTDASGGGTDQVFMAARLLANGTLDNTFGQAGIVTVPIGVTALGYGIALQPDGKLVLSGPAFTTAGVAATARLNPDGTLDPSFGSGGIATLPNWQGVNGIILDPSGRIVMPAVGASAVRVNSNGSADKSFGNGGIAEAPLGDHGGANGAAIQADGKIVIAGGADVNGQTVLTVIRLWAGPIPSKPALPVASPVDSLRMPAAASTVAPALSHLHLASASFDAKRGTVLRITVSEVAAITIRITRVFAAHRPRDLALTRRMAAGRGRFWFRLPGLPAGLYAGTITARSGSGQASQPLTFVFTIRRPKRSR